jgi:hypothetical protein
MLTRFVVQIPPLVAKERSSGRKRRALAGICCYSDRAAGPTLRVSAGQLGGTT